MNLLHMKYAVAVADAGSINKAAAVLLIAQPNLSRAIKETESHLGITIFMRSSKGMRLTPEGENYIGYARRILAEVEEMENHFKSGFSKKQRFSVSVPRASYIADAFADFSAGLGSDPVEIYYQETDSISTVNNLLHANYHLGIIRYEEQFAHYFEQLLSHHGLTGEPVAAFPLSLLMHKDSPLAALSQIRLKDLTALIELSHSGPQLPSLETLPEADSPPGRKIHLFERGSQLELLGRNLQAFAWASPAPAKLLRRYGLVQRPCADGQRLYLDLLAYPKSYKLSQLDKQFIACLKNARKKYLPPP